MTQQMQFENVPYYFRNREEMHTALARLKREHEEALTNPSSDMEQLKLCGDLEMAIAQLKGKIERSETHDFGMRGESKVTAKYGQADGAEPRTSIEASSKNMRRLVLFAEAAYSIFPNTVAEHDRLSAVDPTASSCWLVGLRGVKEEEDYGLPVFDTDAAMGELVARLKVAPDDIMKHLYGEEMSVTPRHRIFYGAGGLAETRSSILRSASDITPVTGFCLRHPNEYLEALVVCGDSWITGFVEAGARMMLSDEYARMSLKPDSENPGYHVLTLDMNLGDSEIQSVAHAAEEYL